ncbi:MAG: hypothetical protein NC453_14730 [Muribaculum sp.]|nr:hypothetical protein [Muribaculum sp.]
MAQRNSKTSFTGDELRQIISLVSALERADTSKQKGIRNKIRNIGLYWSEVAAGVPYTVANLKRLFENGTLKLKEQPFEQIQPTKSDGMTLSEPTESVNHSGRKTSDEHYVIDLCDEILGVSAKRQHRFDFLRGDSGVALPVDAFYPNLNLVIEYHEFQHTQPTPFFDNKTTVSGVSRGEQRRIYDERRQQVLPVHGIKLIVISYTDFGTSKRLNRNKVYDKQVVKKILSNSDII